MRSIYIYIFLIAISPSLDAADITMEELLQKIRAGQVVASEECVPSTTVANDPRLPRKEYTPQEQNRITNQYNNAPEEQRICQGKFVRSYSVEKQKYCEKTCTCEQVCFPDITHITEAAISHCSPDT